MEQRSPEWYAARLGLFTASSFADLMAGLETDAYKGLIKDKAWERTTGQSAGGFTTAAMQHGIDCEPLARDWYTFQTGAAVAEIGFVIHPDFPMAGCSPDGRVGDAGLIEIKCPQPRAHTDTMVARKVPAKYRWQVQGQLWIEGREWCDFVSYHPAQGGVIVRADSSEKDHAALAERVGIAEAAVLDLMEKMK